MDPFKLMANEKWIAFLQTEEGKKLTASNPTLPLVEESLCARLRFEEWANDVMDRQSLEMFRRDKGKP